TQVSYLARFSDPYADPAQDRSRLRFAGGLLAIGILHFVVPKPFEKAVPDWFPDAHAAVFWSGVAELGAGALLAVPKTRRIGGWVATATLVAVYPANIQMAIDATRSGSKPAAAAAWVRLPLQFPMIAKAFGYTR
ncbi:MAG: hypothetical protein WD029_03715, partial [Microthrixaceae bacterium]